MRVQLSVALALVDGDVVSRSRLRGLGVPPSTIGQAVRDGRLARVARGMYAMAASPDLLRMGSELGVLSHRSAAQALRIAVLHPRRVVDVVVPHRRRATPDWVEMHRARLAASDVDVVSGLRVTCVERTLLDLARTLPLADVVVAMDSAIHHGLADSARLHTVSHQAKGPGSGRLRAAVAGSDGRSESPLESLLRLALTSAGHHPDVQAEIAGVGRVDFLFRDEGLVVEADGYAFHADRRSYREDRRRGNVLQAAGYRLLRFTWEDVVHAPDAVVATVRRALARCP
jgi:very-short-patch-repair endonuclease